MRRYEVIVGNIGTVYVGSDRTKAEEQIPTAEQYKVLQALRILMDHGLSDAGVEAIDELLASMGYHLFDSQE